MAGNDEVRVALPRAVFGERERDAVVAPGLTASVFRFDTGVEAIRLGNARGHVVILPYMGQMVWSAEFDGVPLAMTSLFAAPRPARTIVETYGCLAFHSGILRNGVPGVGDSHAPHGEAPCADMDEAGIACGTDDRGAWIAVTGMRDYAMGFGAHYRATPRVVLRRDDPGIEIVMEVENLSAAPMELMYMCHVNFAFAEGARIVQPVPFTPAHVVARASIPGHVAPTPEYLARLAAVAADPSATRVLDGTVGYDPELVFYIKGFEPQPDGRVRFLMIRREGDAFAVEWSPDEMPHAVRWILDNTDQRVAAFAMPATCEPEGYSEEKRKGHVRLLPSQGRARFATRLGYVAKANADAAAAQIEGARA